MRATLCVRFHRRCIIKNFGSCRNLLIWVTSVFITVVLLDHFVFYSPTTSDQKKADGLKTNTSCRQPEKCSEDQVSYQVVSGYDRENHPFICFNGQEIFSPKKKNGKRGFNLVNINGKNLQVEDIRNFDTYEDDTVFQRYYRLGIENSNIIIMASADEASLHLSEGSKKLISSFGSQLINTLEFRDSFVMIGQRNLEPPAKAVEQLVKRKGNDKFASPAIIKGCVSIPLGSVSGNSKVDAALDNNNPVLIEDKIKVGDFSPSCGMAESCKEDHYPIRLYTGSKNLVLPSICFKGKYVLGEKLNNPGRGIEVGVVDLRGGAVVKLERFDTYDSKAESDKLVEFLKGVKDSEMIFALAHDEAQTALSSEAKELLSSFGSSFISGLEFRNVWVFVGKPHLNGYSPYEDIEPSGKDSWPFQIDAKFCIDKKFVGMEKKIELGLKKNIDKRNFCLKYDGYDDFCSASEIDKHSAPAVQTEEVMKLHPVYTLPIIIIPGLSQVSLMKQLQALMRNPGVNVDMINVMYDEKFEESEEVGKLFKVKTTKLTSSSKYINLVHSALSEVWKLYPQADHVILLEEEVIPTHDLLFFLGQCLEVLRTDETLAGVSAFNENGFSDLSSEASVVYRGSSFPGFGLLLKKSFYLQHIKDVVDSCCLNRSWFGWTLPSKYELLYPDISRVSRRTYLGLTEHASFLREYLNSPRVIYSSTEYTKLNGLDSLEMSAYTKMTSLLLSKATVLPNNQLVKCIKNKEKVQLDSDTTYVLYYEQSKSASSLGSSSSSSSSSRMNSEEGDVVLVKLCVCFGINYAPYSHLRGAHQHTLRFHYKKSQVILVSNASPYYSTKPLSQKPFTLSLL